MTPSASPSSTVPAAASQPAAATPTTPNSVAAAGGDPYLELAQAAGGFIHEIKNRVGTLSLNLQLLAEDFDPPQTPRERRALERVQRLHAECQKLVGLAADFLRFARVRDLQLQPTPIEEVVTRLVDFLTPTARQKNIEIKWFVAPDLPPVLLDRDAFEQCLLNLMLNAEQAMPHGGTLTLVGRRDGNWLDLEVIDTGGGIPPEVMPRIFQPFFSTRPDGHGLGLAIARRIVQAHGGSIAVDSTPGCGTCFTIRLPIPESVAPAASPPAESSRTIPPEGTVAASDPPQSEPNLSEY